MYRYIQENRVKVLLFPLLLYWLILFIGTSLPSDGFSDVLEISDKLKHFLAYLVLAFLLSLNLHFQQKWKKLAAYSLISTFLICATYGVFDELHQMLVPNRSAELLDWLADSLGSITGALFSFGFLKIIRK